MSLKGTSLKSYESIKIASEVADYLEKNFGTCGKFTLEEAVREIEKIRKIPVKEFARSQGISKDRATELISEMEGIPHWTSRTKFLENELGLSWTEAKSVYQQYLDGCERAIEEAAIFLANATPPGPRGPRAELVSDLNICKVINWPDSANARIGRYEGERESGIKGLLLDLELTASNPEEHPNIEFNSYDLRKGLYIPTKPEEEAYALGLAYAFAHIYPNPKHPRLIFTGREKDKDLFNHVRSVMEETYNIKAKVTTRKHDPQKATFGGKKREFGECETPQILYSSYGLCEHLVRDYGFPTNREKIKKVRVPEVFRESEQYLKGFLNRAWLDGGGKLWCSHKSKSFLEDLSEIMTNFGVKSSVYGRKEAESHQLVVSYDSTKRLFDLRLIKNPQILEMYYKLDKN